MRELDKEAMFPKDNIARDTKTIRDRIITLIQYKTSSISNRFEQWQSHMRTEGGLGPSKNVEKN